jgi:cysteine desulfurase
MLYLDTASTTPLHPAVGILMTKVMIEHYGNPSSLHQIGLDAENLLKQSRKTFESLIPDAHIFFTSGATEANNWAIESAWMTRSKRGKTILASETSHASVLEKMEAMKARGATVVLLPVQESGILDGQALQSILNEDVIFISLLWVNNETGIIEPVSSLITLIRKKAPHALIHVDAVQGFLKLQKLPGIDEIDFLSISAHKIYGPKGVGALAVNKKMPLVPLIYGGGQEAQKRGGTENVAGICGFAEAAKIFRETRDLNFEKTKKIQEEFEAYILSHLENVRVNGSLESRSPYISSLSIPGIRGEVMVHALTEVGVIVSTGAACSSKKALVSHVLQAMKVPKDFLEGSIRVSFSPDLDLQETLLAAKKIVDTAHALRKATR